MLREYNHLHFIGIGGCGMSALANIMLDLGKHVSGSDLASTLTNYQLNHLTKRGATIFQNHDQKNLDKADLVIYSTSINDDNCEKLAAIKSNLPLWHRSKLLAHLLNQQKGITIAGAHGKTTTTAMIAHVLVTCKVDPTYIIGGESLSLKQNAQAGTSEYLVAEADESDGSFLAYRPYISVITNIEADHLEHYANSFDNLKQAYTIFLNQTKPEGVAILFGDDPLILKTAKQFSGNIIKYALKDTSAEYYANTIVTSGAKTTFTLYHKNSQLGKVTLSLPGKHNILNALAAIATARFLGLEFKTIAAALATFQSTKRRFEVIGLVNDIMIVDDYAHHPTEIKALISGCQALNRKIIAIFQPHRYSRTALFLQEFSHAFQGVSEVIIDRIYAPSGEEPISNISGEHLAALIKKNCNPNVTYLPTHTKIVEHVLKRLKPGILVLTIGAGNIQNVAQQITTKLKDHIYI
ncbi:MAG: hypothetical protein RLZ12_378 [Bacillota bacterium]|jgi:UDP-N-acetylmuramate--alanine ligase